MFCEIICKDPITVKKHVSERRVGSADIRRALLFTEQVEFARKINKTDKRGNYKLKNLSIF